MERRGIELVREWCSTNGLEFQRADKDDDLYNGIDLYIDGKGYDLKASDSGKLSVFRRTAGRGWYCPLADHADVDYLYLYKGAMYFIDRRMFLANFAQLAGTLRWGNYSGDGNYQVYVDLSEALDKLSYRIELTKPK